MQYQQDCWSTITAPSLRIPEWEPWPAATNSHLIPGTFSHRTDTKADGLTLSPCLLLINIARIEWKAPSLLQDLALVLLGPVRIKPKAHSEKPDSLIITNDRHTSHVIPVSFSFKFRHCCTICPSLKVEGETGSHKCQPCDHPALSQGQPFPQLTVWSQEKNLYT